MQNATRTLYNAYTAELARENEVETVRGTFTAKPATEQRAIATAQESHALLEEINLVPVESPDGQSVGVSLNEPLAARTDTDVRGRKPREINLEGLDVYSCKKTEFDVALPYSMLDGWAKFKDFRQRIDKAIGKRQALDRLMIGFNGTHAAEETDREEYPLLQDVNIGWLQKIRTKAPAQVKASGADYGAVTIGATGDYKSLDALVFALIQMLGEHHRKRPDLVVLIDRDLLHTKLLANVAGATDNASELALNRILSSGLIAGIPHRDAPSFPDAAVLVTSLANLSIYYQSETLRRFIKDVPELNQVEDYQSLHEAYVVEDFELVALAENVEFV